MSLISAALGHMWEFLSPQNRVRSVCNTSNLREGVLKDVAIRVSQGGLPNTLCNADRGVALKVKEVKLRHLEDLSRFAHKGVSLPPRVPPPPAILTMVLHSLTLLRVSVLHSLAATRELFRAIVWH